MSFEMCKVCGEYYFSSIHTCQPRWEVFCEDWNDEDNPKAIFARTPEGAAVKFMEINFSNLDYPDEEEVSVRKGPEDEWQRFTVTVETVPSFSATKMEDKS